MNSVGLFTGAIGTITTSSNLDTSNYVLNTSNVICNRITNLPWKDNITFLSYGNVNVYNDKIIQTLSQSLEYPRASLETATGTFPSMYSKTLS